MQKTSRLLLVCVLVLSVVFSSMVLSVTSSITSNVVKNQITPKEQAQFQIIIHNTADVRQRYSLFSFAQGWNVDPSPLKDKIVDINPGETFTATVLVQPTEPFAPGIYYVSLSVESDLGIKESLPLKIYLAPESPYDYLPVIKVSVDMNDKIVPHNPVSIKLFLENKNPLNLGNMSLRLQSEMPEFNKEMVIDLPPLQKKTVELSILPNEYQQPKEYSLFFVFERKGQTVKVVEKKVEVVPIITDFAVDVKQESILLKNFYSLAFTNKGNVLNTQEVKYPTTFWNSLFTQGEARSVVENGKRYLAWDLTLAPGESIVVNFIVNFRILIYILLLIGVTGLLYWLVQPPVVLKKSAVMTRGSEEGTLSEIKITLELENISSNPLKEVTVTDIVPAIVNVERSLDVGTLRPKEITHTKHGTKVTWSLVELDAHEHRIITYKVRAKLNILGTFSLPRGVVEFGKGKRRKGKAYSNVFRIGVE